MLSTLKNSRKVIAMDEQMIGFESLVTFKSVKAQSCADAGIVRTPVIKASNDAAAASYELNFRSSGYN